ncbi:RagB/SusD family nutrient uptake outer membrane protein [Bacteroides sp.]|uniref:RagB/SusD family nutrient uptake outer membrane protein n=1 Tax=Bacteroides sp. TaxID=29523 RepID=UPI0025B9A9E6|nr:RagB/SusD family nutrient uptake outer membrane protein [Bacteroides sp.]
MKKYIYAFLLASVVMTGCEDFKFGDKFLEKPTSDEYNIDSVFNNKIFAEQQLAQVYHTLPDFQPHKNRLSWGIKEGITDLADNLKSGGTSYHKGTLTSKDAAASVYQMSYDIEHGEFSATYGIRQAYIFLNNVDRVPNMTQEEKNIRKGETMMIIAYHYVDIIRNLGGMPWIDKIYSASDDFTMERMTIAESVEKICKLIDDAANLLPWSVKPEDDGRMTKAGALALKSRLLTFVASPLYNNTEPYHEGEAAEKKYVWYGDYSAQRWQDALDAGLDFIRENNRASSQYKLVDYEGEPRRSYFEGYFNRYNGEVLISSHRYTTWDVNCKAVSQIRYSAGCPTLNYADLFETKDGEKFNWDNPDHRKYPFFNRNGEETRDPRLYESLWVTGDKFKGRKAQFYVGGRDVPKTMGGNPQHNWGGLGRTGMGQRKHTLDVYDELRGKFYQCPLLRLPEVYYNIAEAMNELGKATEKDEFGRDAYDYINLVRERVDMPKVTKEKVAPGEDLREYILTERAVEFGYEEVRYYDIMRWKHKDYLDKPIAYLLAYPVEGSKVNGEYTEFTFERDENVINRRVWVENWSDKYYLCPIPLVEINKKYGLIQNPGWE